MSGIKFNLDLKLDLLRSYSGMNKRCEVVNNSLKKKKKKETSFERKRERVRISWGADSTIASLDTVNVLTPNWTRKKNFNILKLKKTKKKRRNGESRNSICWFRMNEKRCISFLKVFKNLKKKKHLPDL